MRTRCSTLRAANTFPEVRARLYLSVASIDQWGKAVQIEIKPAYYDTYVLQRERVTTPTGSVSVAVFKSFKR